MNDTFVYYALVISKSKDFPYSITSIGLGDDPGFLVVSQQVT